MKLRLWGKRSTSSDIPAEPEAPHPSVLVSINEGLNLADDAVYSKVKARQERKSISTLNTLLAIKSHRKRRRIVTHRIKRLKCLIAFLYCIAFILSSPYYYLLYQMYRNSQPEKETLAIDFIFKHVYGTLILETVISITLFVVSTIRLKWPKKENIYYLSHVCYLFAVIHYCILIPLNGRNFQKSLTNLEDYMKTQMQVGRCVKMPVINYVPSKFKTIGRIKDSYGCIVEQKDLKISSIRFEVQKECDGSAQWFWFAKARNLTVEVTVNNKTIQDFISNDAWIRETQYDVPMQWSNSQRRQECCGISSRKDWYSSTKVEAYKKELDKMEKYFIYPTSCCPQSNASRPKPCLHDRTFGGTCTSHEQLTVITYSLSTLVTLVACGIFNLTIFLLLIRYRRMVERFRPDLIDFS